MTARTAACSCVWVTLRIRFAHGSRRDAQNVVVDMLRPDGSVLWPDYASGRSEILAILAAEQR
jgi:hypothetical protein